MRWWLELRQITKVAALQDALAEAVLAETSVRADLGDAREAAERVRAKLAGIEAVAAERRSRIDSLEEEAKYLRAQVDRVLSERLKSLDTINQRLMEPRAQEPAPDMEKYRRQVTQDTGMNAIQQMRQIHRQMDNLILEKLYPQALHGRVSVNEPMGPMEEPALADKE